MKSKSVAGALKGSRATKDFLVASRAKHPGFFEWISKRRILVVAGILISIGAAIVLRSPNKPSGANTAPVLENADEVGGGQGTVEDRGIKTAEQLVQELLQGERIELSAVKFQQGAIPGGIIGDKQSFATMMTGSSLQQLAELGRALKSPELQSIKLSIINNTYEFRDASLDYEFSVRRASRVREHLVKEHGIAAERLSATGLGAEKSSLEAKRAIERQHRRRETGTDYFVRGGEVKMNQTYIYPYKQ